MPIATPIALATSASVSPAAYRSTIASARGAERADGVPDLDRFVSTASRRRSSSRATRAGGPPSRGAPGPAVQQVHRDAIGPARRLAHRRHPPPRGERAREGFRRHVLGEVPVTAHDGEGREQPRMLGPVPLLERREVVVRVAHVARPSPACPIPVGSMLARIAVTARNKSRTRRFPGCAPKENPRYAPVVILSTRWAGTGS